jgi:hypothetical protein
MTHRTTSNPLQPWRQYALKATELLPIIELEAFCHKGLEANFHLISWFGRAARGDEPAGVIVTAVLLPPGEPLRVLRGHAAPGQSYPSLTRDFPAAQIFERELWEQTGLQPDGHPWLKPVRFEARASSAWPTTRFSRCAGPRCTRWVSARSTPG